MDAQGVRVPPAGSRAIPCLHYFLGAAETESEQADENEVRPKLAHGTSQESAVHEEIARLRVGAKQQGPNAPSPASALSLCL